MDKITTNTSILLHFGEWETRRIFRVAMRNIPKKGDMLGLIFVGFETKGVSVLHQVCEVRNVVHRNIDGNLCITASIRSEFKTPFAYIDAEDCYVLSV